MTNKDTSTLVSKAGVISRAVFLLLLLLPVLIAHTQEAPADTPDTTDTEQEDNPGTDDPPLPSDCAPNTVETPSQVVISYDPFLAGVNSGQIKFTLSNESSTNCVMTFSVSMQDAEPNYDYEFADTGVELELRFPDDQQQLRTTKVDGVFEATLAENSTVEYVINAVISKDAVAAAGDHVIGLLFSYTSVNDPSAIATTWETDLILRSVPRAQVNLSGTSGAFGEVGTMSRVDFGIAKKGTTRLVYVQLRSNTESRLKITSQNKGVLKHKEKPKLAPTIPYSAKLDEEKIDLSKEFLKEFDLPKTYAGQSAPLTLKLGDPAGAMAGKYSDILTFEFSPL